MKVTYEVEIQPSDIPVRGTAMDLYDKECEERILQQIRNGNEYAWCDALVTAESGGYTGVMSLGAISCSGRKEFEEVFLPSMKDEALFSLGQDMAAHNGTNETPAYCGNAYPNEHQE